ncbi:MAG: hypothetical protein JSW39_23460 [Desulfobacterales bacterium]|nr:MAG: hypothetical protein JSW39_23460 [Desulfobacterales bacterium]
MRKSGLTLMASLVLVLAVPAWNVQFAFHGDMNNRFLIWTNHNDWLNASDDSIGIISDETVSEQYAELKYRFWFEAADDDDKVKGVYAIEIGGIRFGRSDSSIDNVNFLRPPPALR